jgi:hypothetical protein
MSLWMCVNSKYVISHRNQSSFKFVPMFHYCGINCHIRPECHLLELTNLGLNGMSLGELNLSVIIKSEP